VVREREDAIMNFLWALAVALFVFWMLGFLAFHVTSGFIHVLLALAVIAVVFRLVAGRRLV
jgi:lipopolysaccharide export LptBFGC system permease protein LptF